MSAEQLFVALDHGKLEEALALVERLDGVARRFKVGLELFAAHGPEAVRAVRARGMQVLLDLKLHDIPETVKRAARAAAATGAEWLTVHTAGGLEMLRAAVAGADRAGILGVTVLTSMDEKDLVATGIRGRTVEDLVLERAELAAEAGCAGVIASPREAARIREAMGDKFLIVTPGVRAATGAGGSGGASDDQKRTADARAAIDAGANAVVVGRPIRDAADPRAAAEAILRSLEAA